MVDERVNVVYLQFLAYIALIISVLAWLTNIVGTYLPYPWYLAESPEDTANLIKFPSSYLLSVPHLAIWHEVGMEWKEHLGWIVPILSTPATYILFVYKKTISYYSKLRAAILTLFIVAFIASAITALIGIIITKLAPVR